MTLLTMVQDAASLISLPAANTVVGNSDNAVRILLSAAQREARQLARRWTWQRLARLRSFTALAQVEQTGALPADFDGRLLNETLWNAGRRSRVAGPLNQQEWQQRIGSVGQGPYGAWRIMGNALLISPAPIAADTYSFEYITRNVCASAGGVEQATWTADSDTGLLDEELMLLGIIWRFKQSRGMDYAEDMQTYELEVMQAISRDGARRTVNLTGDCDWGRPNYPAGVTINVGGGGGGDDDFILDQDLLDVDAL